MTVRATDTIHYPGYIDADILAPTSTRGDLIVLDHDDLLIDALVGLNRLRELEEDWDSYGSVPPSHDLLEVAESFVRATDWYFAPFLLPPHITAVSGGGVQFEWHCGVRELEIEFGLIDDGGLPVEYLRVSHGERFNDGVVESTSELLGHLNWIIGG